ncbi:MAG: hypothetical protein Q8N30_02095 [Methylococcales bacterium]|nr:hypothetical protein [Methylococcales bacterium]
MKTHIFLKTALIAGLLAISGTSFAAPTTVTTTFTGTIPTSCSMVAGTVGTLGLSTDGKTMGTAQTNGARGTFALTCTGTANMTIAAPVPNAGTTAATNIASLTTKQSSLYLSTAPSVAIATGDGITNATSKPSGTYQVEMSLGSVSVLATGDYASSVVTTVTPN